MTLQVPDGFCSAAFVYEEHGEDVGTEPYVWTFGFDITGFDGDPVDVANFLNSAWQDAFAPNTTTTLRLDRVVVTVPAPGGGTGTVDSTDSGGFGEKDMDPTYIAFAPKVRKLTAIPGRKYRGLFHPPGLLAIEDVNSDGTIVDTAFETVVSTVDAFITTCVESDVIPVILHTDPALPPTTLNGVAVMPKVGILRDRML